MSKYCHHYFIQRSPKGLSKKRVSHNEESSDRREQKQVKDHHNNDSNCSNQHTHNSEEWESSSKTSIIINLWGFKLFDEDVEQISYQQNNRHPDPEGEYQDKDDG